MAVPYTFGSATTSIPLSQLDSNFATGITLGNTSIQLGNTVTTLNNMTMANVTVENMTSSTVFGFKSRIINGAMVVAQRGTGAVTTDGGFPVDRFRYFYGNSGAYSSQQSSTAPAGFVNSIYFTTTTASGALGATQQMVLNHQIEGFNVADLNWGTANAKTITLSFWVQSSLTGTFGGSLRNNAQNRSYPFTYTIASANTWTQASVTIAGDTTGTWTTDNSTGISVCFGLGVGSTYSGTAGSWAGSDYRSATGATSVIGTLNATFYITGVQLEKGSTATSFDYRPYGTELALCQRYFQTIVSDATAVYARFGMGYVVGVNTMNVQIPLKVTMRTTPTIGTTGTASNYYLASGGGIYACNAVPTINTAGSTANVVSTQPTTASTMVTGNAGEFGSNNASGIYLQFSAEL